MVGGGPRRANRRPTVPPAGASCAWCCSLPRGSVPPVRMFSRSRRATTVKQGALPARGTGTAPVGATTRERAPGGVLGTVAALSRDTVPRRSPLPWGTRTGARRPSRRRVRTMGPAPAAVWLRAPPSPQGARRFAVRLATHPRAHGHVWRIVCGDHFREAWSGWHVFWSCTVAQCQGGRWMFSFENLCFLSLSDFNNTIYK